MLNDILQTGRLDAGIYVTVKSYENDGDDRRTVTKKYKTKEDAMFMVELMNKCSPLYNEVSGYDDSKEMNKAYENVMNFLGQFPFETLSDDLRSDLEKYFKDHISGEMDKDEFMSDVIIDSVSELLHWSECYIMRVPEKTHIIQVNSPVTIDSVILR